MCAIVGLISPTPRPSAELVQMATLLRHRGPDDEGFVLFGKNEAPRVYGGKDTPADAYASGLVHGPRGSIDTQQDQPINFGLGHRRLAIVDLSPLGHQPMATPDGRYWIVFNGEVYNHLELRAELEALGHQFTSHSDTEVILAAYTQWQAACLPRFNGMWSIAIYDTVAETLFLARDRFGVKPLYLYRQGGTLAFASEIKAFTALAQWQAKGNVARILDFLVWNISDHTDETMFEGVTQLAPGHHLTLDVAAIRAGSAGATSVAPTRWYALPVVGQHSPNDAGHLKALLNDAVTLRLRADVEVGSCLSGGLDSSSIVCLMSEQLQAKSANENLHTFTACSYDAQFDESSFAEAISTHANSTAHTITPDPAQLFDDLDRLTWHQDEPFLSTSIFAQWCVFAEAQRRGIKVMLDGQGADEILCGYRGFFGAYLAGLLRAGRLLQWCKAVAAIRVEVGFSPLRSAGYTAAYLMPSLLGLLGRFDNRAYGSRAWLATAYHGAFNADPVRLASGRGASVHAMSSAQVQATNLPMLLRWEDRNSMAFSVEARVPFLDYRLVEFCLALPDDAKLEAGISKSILRRSMRGTVPDKILDRRDKMGFVTAERLWVMRDMAERFRAELATSCEALGGLVAPTLLTQFDEVLAGRRPFDHRYWRVISLGRWVKIFGVTL